MKSNWVVITMGCLSLISLNLFIVAFLAPGWLVYSDYNNQDLELHMGLFYYNQCINNRELCQSDFYDDLNTVIIQSRERVTNIPSFLPANLGPPNGDTIYVEYFVEMLVSIVIMMFACCFVFMYLKVTPPGFLTVPIILLLIPGILVWVATGRFLANHYISRDVMGIPYSLILNGIGACLCFIIVIILIIVMIYDWSKYNGKDRKRLVQRSSEPVAVANPQYVTAGNPQYVTAGNPQYVTSSSQPQLVYY